MEGRGVLVDWSVEVGRLTVGRDDFGASVGLGVEVCVGGAGEGICVGEGVGSSKAATGENATSTLLASVTAASGGTIDPSGRKICQARSPARKETDISTNMSKMPMPQRNTCFEAIFLRPDLAVSSSWTGLKSSRKAEIVL